MPLIKRVPRTVPSAIAPALTPGCACIRPLKALSGGSVSAGLVTLSMIRREIAGSFVSNGGAGFPSTPSPPPEGGQDAPDPRPHARLLFFQHAPAALVVP